MADAAETERVALEIKGASAAGIQLAELGRRLGSAHDQLTKTLDELVADGTVVRASAAKSTGEHAIYCHAEPFARLEKQALGHLDEFYAQNPHKDGMSRQELHAKLPHSLPARLYDTLLRTLSRRGAIEAEADVVRRPQAKSGKAATELSALEKKIAEAFDSWGITPERPKRLPEIVAADVKAVRAACDRLLNTGVLVKIKSDFFVDANALDGLRQKLIAHLDDKGQITPAEWKAITGTSRKFSIPLAEYFDAEKLTLRVGDIRKRRS